MYKTCDLYLASYLKTLNHDLTKIERLEKKVFFIFDCSEKESLGFYNNGLVSAIAFKNSIQELKTIVMHGN